VLSYKDDQQITFSKLKLSVISLMELLQILL